MIFERRQWWDRRMDFKRNVKWLYWRPLVCLWNSHQFTEWYDGRPGEERSWCDVCMIEATRIKKSLDTTTS